MAETEPLRLHYGQRRLLDDQEHKFHLICAGIRYGKSTFGPRWHFKRVQANKRSRESLVTAPDNKLLRAKCLDEYVSFVEGVGLKQGSHKDFEVNLSQLFIRWRFHPKKHITYFLTGEAPHKIRGYTASHAWADEVSVCDEEVHKNLVQRVSCPLADWLLQILETSTPEGENWWYERFGKEEIAEVPGEPFRESDEVLVLEGSTYDNDTLTDDYLKTLEDEFGWDEPYFDTYILGKFVSLARDRFYFGFKEKEHVGDFQLIPEIRRFALCFDNNVGQMTWTVVQQQGRAYFVVDDNGGTGRNIDDACEQFVRKYQPKDFAEFEISIFGDAALHARSVHSYQTGYEIIRSNLFKHYPRLQIKAHRGNPFIDERSRCTNRLFAERRLFISKSCKKVIASAKKTKGDGKGGIIKPKDDTHTHAMESVDMGLIVLEPPLISRRSGGVRSLV